MMRLASSWNIIDARCDDAPTKNANNEYDTAGLLTFDADIIETCVILFGHWWQPTYRRYNYYCKVRYYCGRWVMLLIFLCTCNTRDKQFMDRALQIALTKNLIHDFLWNRPLFGNVKMWIRDFLLILFLKDFFAFLSKFAVRVVFLALYATKCNSNRKSDGIHMRINIASQKIKLPHCVYIRMKSGIQ